MPMPTVVFFSMQAGANEETFNREQFLSEVILPVRDLLVSPSVVHRIIIATLSSSKYDQGEVFTRHLASEDGPPPHLFSPTSDAVSKNLRGPVKEGKVAFLNIEWLDENSSIEYMTNFALASGAQQVIILRHGMRLPSRGILRILHEKMLKDERRSIVCEHTEQLETSA